jgi:hypothetical protein
MFILKKPGDMNELFLIEKKIERSVWQIYDKVKDEWIGLDKGEDRLSCYLREGYELVYNVDKMNALKETIRTETTFSFYSENDCDLPFDSVLIYKDKRLYGKKNFVKNNNGTNNYTIHKIEFTSKKIGKMLGITYNKEITMDVNNDLTKSLKSSIAENRREFNADASTSKNKELCDKAIKKNVINWRTCDIGLLSIKKWREERNKYDESLKPKPSFVVLKVEQVHKPIIVDGVEQVHKPIIVDGVEQVHKPIIVDGVEQVHNPIVVDGVEQVHNPIVVDGVEQVHNPIVVEKEPIIVEEKNPIIVEEVEQVHKPIIVEEKKPIIVEEVKSVLVEEKTNKMILTEISKYIMEKIAENEQFDMTIESCIELFETVKKQLV